MIGPTMLQHDHLHITGPHHQGLPTKLFCTVWPKHLPLLPWQLGYMSHWTNGYLWPQFLKSTLRPWVLEEPIIHHALQEANDQVPRIIKLVKYRDQYTMTNSANNAIDLTHCRSCKQGGSVTAGNTWMDYRFQDFITFLHLLASFVFVIINNLLVVDK
jgi:hypothetical protein